MRKAQKLAAGIAAAMVVSAMSAPVSFAADNAFGIDEINWTDKDWASIAMTNDDTVDTGAVIRTKADEDSKAAGYLYRGAGVRVIDKGEEWTEVRSGRVVMAKLREMWNGGWVLTIVALFMALVVLSIRVVFAKAITMKEEMDLTI